MAQYNGHPSWNAWNVALWIGNDEPLYRAAQAAIKQAKASAARRRKLCPSTRRSWQTYVVQAFEDQTGLLGSRTPDGAVYNRTCIRRALVNLAE